MVARIKADLLESDFSMCLGLLMSYKEPDDPSPILELANKVRLTIISDEPYKRLPSPDLSMYNDLEPEEAKGFGAASESNINMPNSGMTRLQP